MATTGLLVVFLTTGVACGEAPPKSSQPVEQRAATTGLTAADHRRAHLLYLKAKAEMDLRSDASRRQFRVGDPPDALALSALRDEALAASILAGEHHPTGGMVFTTTQRAGLRALGMDVDNEQPAYLVMTRGDFVGYAASVPQGASQPTGTYLWALYDAKTLRGVSWGLTVKPVDLAGLGSATPLGPSAGDQ